MQKMANEKRLIDAHNLWSDIMMLPHNGDMVSSEEVEQAIMDAPTIYAVEVVHGQWERCFGDLHSSGYSIYCSVCNKTHFVHYKYSLGGLTDNELFEKPKYCPSCGAVMEVEE